MITLRNNTKSTSKVGYIVALDPRDSGAFVYVTANATKAVGVITESVAYRKPCKIATLGDTANVFVVGNVVKGDIIRTVKTNDRVSFGACAIVRTGDAPYVRIGEALAPGRGLIPCVLDFTYLQSDGLSIAWNDIGNPPTRIVTDDTIELATDYTIVCNKDTAMTVTLLAATGSNRVREISNIGAGAVTVDANGAETIDGELTQVLSQWDTMDIKDYATSVWKIT